MRSVTSPSVPVRDARVIDPEQRRGLAIVERPPERARAEVAHELGGARARGGVGREAPGVERRRGHGRAKERPQPLRHRLEPTDVGRRDAALIARRVAERLRVGLEAGGERPAFAPSRSTTVFWISARVSRRMRTAGGGAAIAALVQRPDETMPTPPAPATPDDIVAAPPTPVPTPPLTPAPDAAAPAPPPLMRPVQLALASAASAARPETRAARASIHKARHLHGPKPFRTRTRRARSATRGGASSYMRQ